MDIKAILLDVDGTLVDSNRAHAEAWAEAFEEHGYAVDADEVLPLIGMGGDKLMPEVIGIEKDSRLGKKIAEERQELFLEEYISQVKALPGARMFVDEMLKRGYKVVLASSANSEELDELLKKGGLINYNLLRVTADDADASKPAPDIILAALEKAGVSADEAILIGDTKYDVISAHRAGVSCTLVLAGGGEHANSEEADFTSSDLPHLLRDWDKMLDACLA